MRATSLEWHASGSSHSACSKLSNRHECVQQVRLAYRRGHHKCVAAAVEDVNRAVALERAAGEQHVADAVGVRAFDLPSRFGDHEVIDARLNHARGVLRIKAVDIQQQCSKRVQACAVRRAMSGMVDLEIAAVTEVN